MTKYEQIVNELVDLLWEVDDLEDAVRNALAYDIPEMRRYGITSANGFLEFANWLVTAWIPTETTKGKDIYEILCIFYFVLDQEPLGIRQTPITPKSAAKPAEEALTPLSKWVVDFAKVVGLHLGRPRSISDASLLTFWNSPSFHVNEAEIPEGGFGSFNEFFCRKLKPGMRAIDGEGQDKIVFFPADSTFAGAFEISDESEVVLKGLPWKVSDLLKGSDGKPSPNAGSFEDGVWMHCFLNTFDYHRQHAPVSGKVIEAKNIDGAAYLEVIVKRDEKTQTNYLAPCRRMRGKAKAKTGDEVGTLDAPDSPGYQFLQARGLIVIDNPKLGKVAVLPIGMAQVSSVVLVPDLVGKEIKKGQEISHFEFGGSDCVMLFEKKARVSGFPDSEVRTHYNYGEKLCTAHFKL
ncbi:hypothetical protein AJ79_08665 [Helicocarpus griseus UAMH5409]|uniref:Phosphatidylserine decarboxylase n=1 Tax=Helicocarpus griseus UAMH5409 TaxID=1447875 RepID=A0A2B7WIG5_9EURO|nr:hypothetical protein AJ79_08665 [Helicocarpus griseus UAMH5409]